MALLVSMTLFAERVSVEDAAVVANNFMNVTSASGIKKATPAKRMVHKAVAEENLYYIYQNADGEGWVIVAADDAVMPILAYSETGTFRTDNMPVNVREWMSKYNNFIRKIENDGVVAGAETQAEWNALRKGARKATAAAVVGPLIKTTWDQDSPYWNLCPGTGNNKCYTGCVATALAQVMKYWEWPVTGTGSHTYRPLDVNNPYINNDYNSPNYSSYGQQSANFGATTYDWSNMKNSYSGNYTEAQATAVATLMYHCGVAVEMMYGNAQEGGSGALTVNYGTWSSAEWPCSQNALVDYFGYKREGLTSYVRDGYREQGYTFYTSWTDANWTAMVKAELDLNHPILYGGDGTEGGHSFICDGYDNSSTTKFHFNWGWSGQNDGYYLLSNLVPGSGGAGGGSYNFSDHQEVIIGIVPDRPLVDPFEITWMSNGTQFTTTTSTGTVVLPTTEPTACEGKVFVGWCSQANYNNATTAPTFVKAGDAVEEGAIFYAVFATQEGEGGASFDGTSSGSFKIYANVNGTKHYATSVSSKKLQSTTNEADATTFTFTAVNGGFTISNGSKYIKHGSGTDISAVNDAYTWTISAGEQGTWRINSQTSGRALLFRASTYNVFGGYATSNANGTEYFDVEIGDENTATYSNYSTSCGGGTDIENTTVKQAAVKVIENGQVIIIRDNEKYSIFGQKIK